MWNNGPTTNCMPDATSCLEVLMFKEFSWIVMGLMGQDKSLGSTRRSAESDQGKKQRLYVISVLMIGQAFIFK